MISSNGLETEAKEIVARYPERKQRAAVVPLLHRAQERDGFVTAQAIEEIGRFLGLSAAEVRGVASFYSMLHLEPKGRHVVSVCHNIACTIAGAERLISALEKRLGVRAGSTTSDGEFTLERAECLAACELAPMIQLDYDRMIGPLTADQATAIVEELAGSTLERSREAIDEIGIAPRPSLRLGQAVRRLPAEDTALKEPAPLIDSIRLTDEDRLLLHPEIVFKIHEPAPEDRESSRDTPVPPTPDKNKDEQEGGQDA